MSTSVASMQDPGETFPDASRIAILILFILTACSAVVGVYVAFDISPARYEESYGPILTACLFLAGLCGCAAYLTRPRFRIGGLFLCTLLLLLWMSLLLVFEKTIAAEKWAETLGIALITGLPAGFGLLFHRTAWGRVFAWSLLAVSVCSATMMLPHAWLDGFTLFGYSSAPRSELAQKFLQAGAFFQGFLAPACLLLINLGQKDRHYFRLPGLFAAVLGFAASCQMVFDRETPYRKLDVCILEICAFAVGVLALINVTLMFREKGIVRISKWLAIGILSLFGIFNAVAVLARYFEWDIGASTGESLFRLSIAGAFTACSAVVCVIIAHAYARIVPPPTSPSHIRQVSITCPNCLAPSAISLPAGKCPQCLLEFQISVTDPRCTKCRHLLINLTSDQCPECGEPVARPSRLSPTSTTHTAPAQSASPDPSPS